MHHYITPWLLIERGGCSFVEKVRNAEEAGAGLAVIVDNNAEDDVTRLAISDDGSGSGLRIPSMLISYDDGKKITDFLKTCSEEEAKNIMMLAEFDIKRSDDIVHYDLWYSAVND